LAVRGKLYELDDFSGLSQVIVEVSKKKKRKFTEWN
jgi:hypothetical protein